MACAPVWARAFLNFDRADADAFCLQETKMQEGQADLELPAIPSTGTAPKGYSGTAVFTRLPVVSAAYGIGIPSTTAKAG